MIDSRIRRALWAVLLLIVLGFGGISAYEYQRSASNAAFVEKLNAQNSALVKECAGLSLEDRQLSMCETRQQHMLEAISEFSGYQSDASKAAEQSLRIAVGTPIVFWMLYYLMRWIWSGRFSSRHVAERSTKLAGQNGQDSNASGR